MKIIILIYKFFISRRYNVKIKNTKVLKHNGPILLLPNHVALVDPQILMTFLDRYLKLSPVASEKFFNVPVLKQIMKAVGTIPIGEMDQGADAEKVKAVFSKVSEAMKEGKNILIYPSGEIYKQGFESIIGKQAVYNIVQNMPENTRVIGLRQRGLWGSMWSKAWDSGKTGFFTLFLKGVFYVFVNLIFFVPKRKVSIELEDISEHIKLYKNMNLGEFNKYLESFYNKYQEENINYIKHFWFYNNVKNKNKPEIIKGSLVDLENTKSYDLSKIDKEIKNKIIKKISLIKELDINKINENSKLIVDLFFDSLDLAEIKSFVQANFKESSNPPITDLKTVGDLIIMAVGQSENIEEMKKCEWKDFGEKGELIEKIKENKNTIPQLWKQNFKNKKKQDFLWDNILGLQTKKDFILKVYFIAGRIKKIKGDYVGIMLPAVGGASLLIMATYLAGKIPVMFNWTLPVDAFKHCVNFSKVEKIISVSSFFDRVETDILKEYKNKDKFIFLEDLLKDGKITEKIGAFVKSVFMPLPKNNNEIAVILFTSGSESLPKAVALTHKNLVENIIGSIDIFKIQKDDVLLGFLPSFHSFGFTVNTIMPLITGLRVVYTPDPNDAKTILEVIKNSKITALTATPTFLKMIMSLASGDDLKTIKYAVVGAEKCPQIVFDKFRELCQNGKILEGYGITECSPVVAINPIKGAKPGTVGKVISCLDCKIISVDSNEECKIGEQGMIYVKGKSIFNGYLDKKIESPFIETDGKKFYKTGDLGFLDKDGFLTITGRLKRFIKIAGEMISLPFVEEVLVKKYNIANELEIAIEALEKDGEVKIVLFSINDLDLDELNSYMRENGVPNLVKISEIIKVNEIPVLGTGKTDYKVLKKMISFEKNVEKQENYNFENIDETLKIKISELTGIEKEKIKLESEFGKNIHIDSIDVGELMVFIRKNYDIQGKIKVEEIKIFKDLVYLVKNKGIQK